MFAALVVATTNTTEDRARASAVRACPRVRRHHRGGRFRHHRSRGSQSPDFSTSLLRDCPACPPINAGRACNTCQGAAGARSLTNRCQERRGDIFAVLVANDTSHLTATALDRNAVSRRWAKRWTSRAVPSTVRSPTKVSTLPLPCETPEESPRLGDDQRRVPHRWRPR